MVLPTCREFQTPDEEMKKIVLKVVKQCVGTEGVEPDYIRAEVRAEAVGLWRGGGHGSQTLGPCAMFSLERRCSP